MVVYIAMNYRFHTQYFHFTRFSYTISLLLCVCVSLNFGAYTIHMHHFKCFGVGPYHNFTIQMVKYFVASKKQFFMCIKIEWWTCTLKCMVCACVCVYVFNKFTISFFPSFNQFLYISFLKWWLCTIYIKTWKMLPTMLTNIESFVLAEKEAED